MGAVVAPVDAMGAALMVAEANVSRQRAMVAADLVLAAVYMALDDRGRGSSGMISFFMKVLGSLS